MTYYINFALNLKKDNSNIIYNSELFADKPISITSPTVVKIIEEFIKGFENVGIVEKEKGENNLQPLSGEVLICKVQDLDSKHLDKFKKNIAEKLSTCLSEITEDNLDSEELTVPFSEAKELMELRNYLCDYVITKKKNFQKGYIVMMR